MRPTGRLDLGHDQGVLKNWVRRHEESECFYFVADWYALTTYCEESASMDDLAWGLHRVYMSQEKHDELAEDCKSTTIGCVDCKRSLLDSLLKEQTLHRERVEPFEKDPGKTWEVNELGWTPAWVVAQETLNEMRAALGMRYT